MREEYQHLIQKNAEIESVLSNMRESAIAEVRSIMEKYQIKESDIFVAGRLKKINAKYRNPETGQTWTGRGSPPRWLAGTDREKFRI